MADIYTGRQIAILTDLHALLEPTIAILNDIKARGIKEIYSLGDNIGVGPNPSEVLSFLDSYGVVSVMGNSEEYTALGIEPFRSYFSQAKIISQEWTKAQLTAAQIGKLKCGIHSIDLTVGGKKIALCHFANDVRIDFSGHSTWTYQASVRNGNPEPQKQFYYTNSPMQKQEIAIRSQTGLPEDKGFASAAKDPLFGGKTVSDYDEIIQGHVHFRILTQDANVKVRTIRAAAMAFQDDPLDLASYVIIKERTEGGYDVEEVLVPFDREMMLEDIAYSSLPVKEPINRFVSR
jgi:hypothetical protein